MQKNKSKARSNGVLICIDDRFLFQKNRRVERSQYFDRDSNNNNNKHSSSR